MGASTFPILAEMYLQFTECNNIHEVLTKYKITGYVIYVDDVLLIHDEELTHVNLTLQEFNNIHPKLQFTIEKEQNNKINFLDVTIQRTENLSYSTYLNCQPSTT
jgi:predicted transcriptional regulator